MSLFTLLVHILAEAEDVALAAALVHAMNVEWEAADREFLLRCGIFEVLWVKMEGAAAFQQAEIATRWEAAEEKKKKKKPKKVKADGDDDGAAAADKAAADKKDDKDGDKDEEKHLVEQTNVHGAFGALYNLLLVQVLGTSQADLKSYAAGSLLPMQVCVVVCVCVCVCVDPLFGVVSLLEFSLVCSLFC